MTMSGNQRLPVLVNIQTNERTTLGASVMVGRAPENQVVLHDDEYASAEHARFFWENGWFVEDAGSSNGTFVNDQLISTRHALAPNDVITIGRTTFKVE
jgi:pSer/pThr/pTyr-binding forkhead associated (FHA) protein